MPDNTLEHLEGDNLDYIKGVTLEERSRLILMTLGKTPDRIRKAYRKMANLHHPDKAGGGTLRFQVIKEAYELLAKGKIPGRPLLADDRLIVKLIGRQVQPLMDKQKQWEEYERWRRSHFYGEKGERL